jgi:transposase-like protein
MTKQRRSFSAEFKREAAGLVLDQGYSHIEACRSLGVVESALRRWVAGSLARSASAGAHWCYSSKQGADT